MLSMSEIDRFTDIAFMQGDFKKVNTSPSQTCLPNWMWFIKYPLALHLNFKPESPSISFMTGTAVHRFFQNILIGKMKITDVEKYYKNILENNKFPEKEYIKGTFILKKIEKMVSSHLDILKEISGKYIKDWEIEVSFSNWYDNKYMGQTLNIANDGSIDCRNQPLKIFTEHKNRFPSVYLSNAKKHKGEKVYNSRKPNTLKSPHFTHLIAVSMYANHLGKDYEAALIYVDGDGATLFNKHNCEDLTQEGLKYYFNKFIQINIQRQEMLRMAQGDIKKLACMVGVDWSEIKKYKDNLFLCHIQDEDVQKMERFYDSL